MSPPHSRKPSIIYIKLYNLFDLFFKGVPVNGEMDPSSSGGAAPQPRNMAAIDMSLDDVIMTKSKQRNLQRLKTVDRTGNAGSVSKSTSRPRGPTFTLRQGDRSTFSSARTVEASSDRGRSLRISVDARRVNSKLSDRASGGRPQSSLSVSNLHHEVSESDLIVPPLRFATLYLLLAVKGAFWDCRQSDVGPA